MPLAQAADLAGQATPSHLSGPRAADRLSPGTTTGTGSAQPECLTLWPRTVAAKGQRPLSCWGLGLQGWGWGFPWRPLSQPMSELREEEAEWGLLLGAETQTCSGEARGPCLQPGHSGPSASL